MSTLDETKTPDAWKHQGNKFFSEYHYAQAIECYSKAIELSNSASDNEKLAIYLSNRSICNIKLENYGDAVIDATKAIEYNPAYVKAYYRRGDALLLLQKPRDALQDFRTVKKKNPSSKEAIAKVEECKKIILELEFSAAIESSSPDPTTTIKLDEIEVLSSYEGPRFDSEKISLEFVEQMIEWFRNQKKLHIKYAYRILMEVIAYMKSQPTIMHIIIPPQKHFTVCGDVHGQFYDMLNIFKLNGNPSPDNPYLFNGDFVDRGSFSCEVIYTLLAYKLLYPDGMYLTRGNHETNNMNLMYGFHGEVLAKYDKTTFDLFERAFNWLPLGAVLGRKVLILHGGLFDDEKVTLEDLEKIDRARQPPDSGPMCEMLWSDPVKQNGKVPSKRGVALGFGPDITERFLKRNNLELIVRSHEVKDNGYEIEPNCRLVTVFSAPNYCDQMGNKGAYIRFNDKYVPEYHTFSAVPHPDVKPMAYARNMMNFM